MLIPSMVLGLSLIPASLAIEAAVSGLSPVTILTLIPASLVSLIAWGTSSLTGSSIA